MMDLLMLFMDKRSVAKWLRRLRKRLLRKKSRFLKELDLFLTCQAGIERFVAEAMGVSRKCYYLRMAKHLRELLQIVVGDMARSHDVYPKIAVHRKVIDVINKINEIQETQQKFVSELLESSHHRHITCAKSAPADVVAVGRGGGGGGGSDKDDDHDDDDFHNVEI